MISAKELCIVWGDNPSYWDWITLSDIRFQKVAHLIYVRWLEISGKIESKMLTKKTRYTAYLVYRLDETSYGFSFPAQETIIKVGMNDSKRHVRLSERIEEEELEEIEDLNEIRVPSTRNDGWLEIEMGEFYNDNGDDGEIHISLLETEEGHMKDGLTVYGIEVRPKK